MTDTRLHHPLQRRVLDSWLNDTITTEDGHRRFSPFELGVHAALQDWDPQQQQQPFVMVELGCGSGRNSVPLVSRAKHMIRSICATARICVYQMDCCIEYKEQVMTTANQNWTDELCECVFLGQSFFDDRGFYRLNKNQKINFLFSEASLHFIDGPAIPLSQMASPIARDSARFAMERVFRSFCQRRAHPRAAMAVLCNGTDDEDNSTAPFLTWMEKVYGQAIREGFPDHCESILQVHQVSHCMNDLRQIVSNLSCDASWEYEGVVGTTPRPPKMTAKIAKLASSPMLNAFWPNHLQDLAKTNQSTEQHTEAWKRTTKAMEKSLLKHGFEPTPSQISFVVSFK